MEVTIIGAGKMGRAIGTRLIAGGNDVTILDRDAGEAKQLAEELARNANGGGSAAGGAAGDELKGSVVVLAVYYDSAQSLVDQYADALDGKIVIDITNPVDTETFAALVTPPDSSAAQELGKKAPGARMVKAFNTTFANTLVEGEVDGQSLDVFIAADDEKAKDTVAELVKGGGLRPLDAGPLGRARELEALGFLHMTMQNELGTGYRSTVKILS